MNDLLIRADSAMDVAKAAWVPTYMQAGFKLFSAEDVPGVLEAQEAFNGEPSSAWPHVQQLHEKLAAKVSAVVGCVVVPTMAVGPALHTEGSASLGHIDQHPRQMFCMVLTFGAWQDWVIDTLDMAIGRHGERAELPVSEESVVLYEGVRLVHGRAPYRGKRITLAHLYYRPLDFAQ